MKELGFATQHEIRISPTCNFGFILTIGCAKLAVSCAKELKEIIEEYFHDPEGWEKKYNKLRGPISSEAPMRESDRGESTPEPGVDEEVPQRNRAVTPGASGSSVLTPR